jgi:hypothetical protein
LGLSCTPFSTVSRSRPVDSTFELGHNVKQMQAESKGCHRDGSFHEFLAWPGWSIVAGQRMEGMRPGACSSVEAQYVPEGVGDLFLLEGGNSSEKRESEGAPGDGFS